MKVLHSGTFLWPIYNKIGQLKCPTLPEKLNCEVIVVGGGISGLLTAFQLWKNNVPFVLVEANKIGYGSTLASTGLIQYTSDIRLPDLRSTIGREQADCFYLASAQAVQDIAEIAALLKDEIGDSHFFFRESIQYASSEDDVVNITQQFNAFQSINLPCELLGKEQLQSMFSKLNTVALQTFRDAELNPHLFVLYLAAFLLRKGVQLYEHALFKSSQREEVNYKSTYTINDRILVNANHIIYTIGYSPEQLAERDIHPILNRSYVVTTTPIKKLPPRYNKQMIWETVYPYHYIRTTVDSRLIIGGLDEKIATPNTNIEEIAIKNKQLLKILYDLFPSINCEIAYSWNATFAESADKLPFIGPSLTKRNVSYLCGYGGNGTVYSAIGAKLLAEYINKPKQYEINPLSHIVKLNRLNPLSKA